MEKDIAQGNIGAVGKYDVAITGGKLVLKVGASYPVGSTAIEQAIDLAHLKEAIKVAIPGKYDDMALDLLFNALVGV